MTNYQAKNFNNRKALEDQIISDHGKNVDKKDVKIVGTDVELQSLRLQHGQSIWGVTVEQTDYKVNNYKAPDRGKKFRSEINGVII